MTKTYIQNKALVTEFQSSPDDIHYPSEKLVKDSLDDLDDKFGDYQEKHLVTSWNTTTSDGRYPSEKLVKDSLDAKEPVISTKGTAFNKSFGTVADTVCQGNDSRLSDSRTPTAHHTTHENSGTDRIVIDATQITTGVIDASHIPQGAFQKLVTVANESARKALTSSDVNNGDTVKQNDTGVMYYVLDNTALSTDAGWAVYVAITDWNCVSNKPTSFNPSTHANSHTNGTDDIQTADSTKKGLLSSADWSTFNGKQNQHIAATIPLYPKDWSGGLNEVEVVGVTATSTVISGAEGSTFTLYCDHKIHLVSQGTDTLTFAYSGTEPTQTINVSVAVFN